MLVPVRRWPQPNRLRTGTRDRSRSIRTPAFRYPTRRAAGHARRSIQMRLERLPFRRGVTGIAAFGALHAHPDDAGDDQIQVFHQGVRDASQACQGIGRGIVVGQGRLQTHTRFRGDLLDDCRAGRGERAFCCDGKSACIGRPPARNVSIAAVMDAGSCCVDQLIGLCSGDPVHSACDQRNLTKVGQATSSPLEVVADARCGSLA